MIISFIISPITFLKEIIFRKLYDNLNIDKTINPRYCIVPPSDPICTFDMLFIFNKHNFMQRDHWGNNHLKTLFLITMNYAQKYYPFSHFFIKVAVNKSNAYSFSNCYDAFTQTIFHSVIMLRFHIFTAKQGT